MRGLTGALIAITLLFAGCQEQQPAPRKPVISAANQKGHQLFLSHCVSCHMGTTDASAPNDIILYSGTLNNEASFKALLRHPTSATMPAFDEKSLNDEAVHELYDYLVSQRAQ